MCLRANAPNKCPNNGLSYLVDELLQECEGLRSDFATELGKFRKQKRISRVLANFVGSAAQTLFGLVSEKELDKVYKHIAKLYKYAQS
jgi:hypothetical protein